MWYILFFVICLLGILFHNSKIMGIIVWGYIFIIMSLNYQNPDTYSYQMIYLDPMNAQEEIGFRIICWIFASLGIPYDFFRFILIGAGLLLMLAGIKKLLGVRKKNMAFLGSLYMLISMMMDTILLRNFLVTSILVYTLNYYINREYMKFVIGILIASLMHTVGLFWFSLLFVRNIRSLKSIWKILLISIITMYMLLGTSLFGQFLAFLGINQGKIDVWLRVGDIQRVFGLSAIVFTTLNIIIFFIARHYVQGVLYKSDLYRVKLEKLAFSVNIVSLILLFIWPLISSSIRVFFVIALINSLYYIELLSYLKTVKGRIYLKILSTIVPIGLFLYEMFVYQTLDGEVYFDFVFKEIIDHNLLSLL